VTQAILVPGFGGTSKQSMLVQLKKRLKVAGITGKAITLKAGRPKTDLAVEVEQLRKAAKDAQVLIGRSFGGRVCARLAVERPPLALVLLGYPIRPPGRPRPLDEVALRALRCPTLILQGADDELGPIEVLAEVLADQRSVTIEAIEGAGHSYGRHEGRVLDRAVAWLDEVLTAS
jgi:predicted alpha/beta-hydrolase family hydrolase